jgi:hypothetical protein
LTAAECAIVAAVAPLDGWSPPDAESVLVSVEFRNAAAILRHAVHLARRRLAAGGGGADDVAALVKEHRRLWLARNRPGGLDDSASRLLPRTSGTDTGWI